MHNKPKKRIKNKAVLSIVLLGLIAGTSYYYVFAPKITELKNIEATRQAVEETKKEILQDAEKGEKPRPEPGKKIGVLSIPSINLTVAVTYGLDPDGTKTFDNTNHQLLSNKSAIVAGSGLPGGGKQIYIAGHRDESFRRLKNLKEGAEIVVTTSGGVYTYVYTKSKVVPETASDVIDFSSKTEELVLQTCYPIDSTDKDPKERILFYASPR